MTTTGTDAAADSGRDEYKPYSNLATILRGRIPPTTDDPGLALYAAISTAAAISTVGKLLALCDARELEPADIRDVGELIITLGEVSLELVNASADAGTDPAAALAAQGSPS